MLAIDVHPDVYEELERSRSWYEERAEDLGREFLVEVSRAMETIREDPAIWPFYDLQREIRRYLVHRFPYGVVYRTVGSKVQVIAVMHLRRPPEYWTNRLQYWNGNASG